LGAQETFLHIINVENSCAAFSLNVYLFFQDYSVNRKIPHLFEKNIF